jgi:predicted enzyme related to lactoylglutathione lyase
MADKLRYLALNVDDAQRAKTFYEAVFGWTFEPWGPPDYYQSLNAATGALVALHGRRELKPGARMLGLEATMAVADLDAAIAAIEAAGGRVLTPPSYIQDVGRLIYFEDSEGNIVSAMQYDAPELQRISEVGAGP